MFDPMKESVNRKNR